MRYIKTCKTNHFRKSNTSEVTKINFLNIILVIHEMMEIDYVRATAHNAMEDGKTVIDITN
jgi:hypothetical protein